MFESFDKFVVQQKKDNEWKTLKSFDDEFDALTFIHEYGTRDIRLLHNSKQIKIDFTKIE